jgi:acetyl-CoA carboxylase biotin carboxyl carrier protein
VVRATDDRGRRQQLQDDIRELASLMRECDLAEIVIEEGKESRKLVVRRGVVAPTVAASTPVSALSSSVPAKSGAEPSTLNKDSEEIRSPIPGTFYAAPRPGEPPFVAVGDTVEPGQILCIVEAMKLMNEVEAEFACEILEVLVENATLVGYGHPLFRVRRT